MTKQAMQIGSVRHPAAMALWVAALTAACGGATFTETHEGDGSAGQDASPGGDASFTPEASPGPDVSPGHDASGGPDGSPGPDASPGVDASPMGDAGDAAPCTSPLTSCPGGCVNTQTDRINCGACGASCTLLHAIPSCVGGSCAVASCTTGWGNCDGIAANGCEVDLTGNTSNCGACGSVCPSFPHGTAACTGSCTLGACAAGWGNCDGAAMNGCEVNVSSDVNNCGSCGHACGSGMACSASSCVVASTSTVLSFPLSTDTLHEASGTNYWNVGDYVDGSRVTTLSSTVSAVIHVVLAANSLTCDTQDMEMTINGVVVGSFSVQSGATTVASSFAFSAITGPTYDLRYQTTRTVASGCGSSGISTSGSTVTLN